MSKAHLFDLSDLCQRAAGPDNDLDREIWLTVVADDSQRELIQVGRSLHGDGEAAFRLDRLMDGLRYTASLDDAKMLVPEGFEWGCGSNDGDSGPWAWCDERDELPDDYLKNAATTALALCVAALAARAASADTHPKDGDVEQAPLVSGATAKPGRTNPVSTPPQANNQ